MISILVINYGKPELAAGFCRSLAKLAGRNHVKVLILDNGATDLTRSVIAEIIEEVQPLGLTVEVLHEPANWGYFGGARVGLEHLRKGGLPEWVIISNSDIEFTDAKFIEQLESIRQVGGAGAGVGVIGPKILSGLSGTNQNPYMLERPSAARMRFYKLAFQNTVTCFSYQFLGLAKSKVKSWLGHKAPEFEARNIYAPHGAFLIFSREYFERGGDFKHEPFLFGEEITVAENCRRLGLKARYEPALVVSHIEHASIGVFPSKKMLEFQREASAYCADTYFASK